jgi:hypothetical protein
LYFLHHVRALSLKVVSSCLILDSSSVTLIGHIDFHVNQCYFSSSLPIPWNAGSLKVDSWFTIIVLTPCLPEWLLLVVVDTYIHFFKVLLTSLSPLLISFDISYFVSLTYTSLTSASLTFSPSSGSCSWWKMHKVGGSKKGFLYTLSLSFVRDPKEPPTCSRTRPLTIVKASSPSHRGQLSSLVAFTLLIYASSSSDVTTYLMLGNGSI